jgi:putative transposase
VWSWDISRLRGPGPRDWFYLYVILDIFSRKIVGWCIDTEETETVAKRLITITCQRENIEADQLTLHSDRGAQMTSTTIAELLEDLSVTRSLSRPRVSDDNPYSEAAFKTVKYRPSYPDRFDSIDDARVWMRKFVGWYNTEHYHSGIGYLHPTDLHNGTANDHRRPPAGSRRRLPGPPRTVHRRAAHRRPAPSRRLDQQANHPNKELDQPATTT